VRRGTPLRSRPACFEGLSPTHTEPLGKSLCVFRLAFASSQRRDYAHGAADKLQQNKDCGAVSVTLEAHRFQISLLSRCTAMLAGLRTLKTRHGPD
jgi:hypothetical protein